MNNRKFKKSQVLLIVALLSLSFLFISGCQTKSQGSNTRFAQSMPSLIQEQVKLPAQETEDAVVQTQNEVSDAKSVVQESANATQNILDIPASATNEDYQIIRMDVTGQGWVPNKFVLKKGVPVKWIINGKQITGCNNAIIVPAYNLQFKIKSGEQTIEFTPDEAGVVPWSCWMGMIRGTFIVE